MFLAFITPKPHHCRHESHNQETTREQQQQLPTQTPPKPTFAVPCCISRAVGVLTAMLFAMQLSCCRCGPRGSFFVLCGRRESLTLLSCKDGVMCYFHILTASTFALLACVVQCFAVSSAVGVHPGCVGSEICMLSVRPQRHVFHAVLTKGVVDFAKLKG